jgi:hypothetical protein
MVAAACTHLFFTEALGHIAGLAAAVVEETAAAVAVQEGVALEV